MACFDTSFHATLPDTAATDALPGRWRRRWHSTSAGTVSEQASRRRPPR
ncbi:MAG TPA: hypothetical protein VGJ95_22325 [Pseudonocardiaceae bacterium]